MHDVVILAIKGLAGGVLVVAFALLSQGLEPKRFAGLFSAAPAVALAGLTVTLLDKGPHDAHQSAAGMIAGGVGMAVYAAAVIPLLRRVRPARASIGAIGVWTLAAAIVAVPLLAA
ncbi:MAG TPA: DUF3147 family protein [Solirubrobacteraceae bacterium]|nr:DUF3147 family protein [Solirubrobacteraceae bacterium]